VPDDPRRRQPRDRLAVEEDVAGARLHETEHHLHGRGLAARIAAQKADHAAALDREAQVEMHLHGPVERIDAVEPEQRRGFRSVEARRRRIRVHCAATFCRPISP
jgi:hypothetical protein